MGGCFPCFGSSNNEEGSGGLKREVNSKKDSSSVKDGSAVAAESQHHLSKVASGKRLKKEEKLICLLGNDYCLFSVLDFGKLPTNFAVIPGFLGQLVGAVMWRSLLELALPLI